MPDQHFAAQAHIKVGGQIPGKDGAGLINGDERQPGRTGWRGGLAIGGDAERCRWTGQQAHAHRRHQHLVGGRPGVEDLKIVGAGGAGQPVSVCLAVADPVGADPWHHRPGKLQFRQCPAAGLIEHLHAGQVLRGGGQDVEVGDVLPLQGQALLDEGELRWVVRQGCYSTANPIALLHRQHPPGGGLDVGVLEDPDAVGLRR